MFFKLELYPEALFQEVTEVHNNKSSAILQICKLLLFLHTSMSSTFLLEIKYPQQRFFCSSNLFYFNLKLQWNYLVVQDLFLWNRWWPLGHSCLVLTPKSKRSNLSCSFPEHRMCKVSFDFHQISTKVLLLKEIKSFQKSKIKCTQNNFILVTRNFLFFFFLFFIFVII